MWCDIIFSMSFLTFPLFLFYFQNLTGGKKGGRHVTDVTNASRTMLMNINTLKWDDFLCR